MTITPEVLAEGRRLRAAAEREQATIAPSRPWPATVDWLVWARNHAGALLDQLDRQERELDDRRAYQGMHRMVERAERAEAALARVRGLADNLLREFTANIPISKPDPAWDPHDEFRRCAIDRRDRVKRWCGELLDTLNGARQ